MTTPADLILRYQRAAALTPPKFAASVANLAVEGYWLNGRLFFFVEEEAASGARKRVWPKLFDAETGDVRAALDEDTLRSLARSAMGRDIDADENGQVSFDMPDVDTLAVNLSHTVILIDLRSRSVCAVTPALAKAALYAPNGLLACVVEGDGLCILKRDGSERTLVAGAGPHVRLGQEPDTCLRAVSYRRCPYPVGLWSPDSRWFFTHRIDERATPDAALIENAPTQGDRRPRLHNFKTPLPGDPVATLTYVAIDVASGELISFDDWSGPAHNFSPFSQRWAWFDEAGCAWALRFDRFRRRVDLLTFDVAAGSARVKLSELVDCGYINLNPINVHTPNVRVLGASNEIIWFSERDGWGHLYLYDGDTGCLKRQLTQGEFVVRDIVDVDEAARKVFFLAGALAPDRDPARRSLCVVGLDDGAMHVIATGRGDLFAAPTEPQGLDASRPYRPTNAPPALCPTGSWIVSAERSVGSGDVVSALNLSNGRARVLARAIPGPKEPNARTVSALAADGRTVLYGALFTPSDFDAASIYPLVDYIYPGPQTTHQPQSYASTNATQARALAELGFATLMIDTRAMPGASRFRHQIGYGALLEPQLADHASFVTALCERERFLDRGRIGVLGWSGGGAAAARAMFDYGDIFKVGVSICGNHDSSLYASAWSDRLRGPPHETSWAGQDNSAAAHRLTGRLLLVSGDMDENVHLAQTLRLADALIAADRDFDILIVPNAGHDVLMKSAYAQRRVWDFFLRHLRGVEPPATFALSYDDHELKAYDALAARELKQ